MFRTAARLDSAAGRRNLRERKVSQRMAVVDDSARQLAVQSRLDALEADNEVVEDALAAAGKVAVSGKRKRSSKKGAAASAGPKRKTRGMAGAAGPGGTRGPRTFARLLEEA
ncbi:zinc finger HIT domain-containing protein 1 [Haematococcus lacustris]|uniref:Zinc finger HIT domain-containing protein 1 n=1 Tax=Haematococcus lacustris TaxID=44745 RepID=A0A699ZQJ3_HAELA|nr:zinc finger HIT domain-containing protein 1 [Haematococcus lacustris]